MTRCGVLRGSLGLLETLEALDRPSTLLRKDLTVGLPLVLAVSVWRRFRCSKMRFLRVAACSLIDPIDWMSTA
jgi:hypothetical protein